VATVPGFPGRLGTARWTTCRRQRWPSLPAAASGIGLGLAKVPGEGRCEGRHGRICARNHLDEGRRVVRPQWSKRQCPGHPAGRNRPGRLRPCSRTIAAHLRERSTSFVNNAGMGNRRLRQGSQVRPTWGLGSLGRHDRGRHQTASRPILPHLLRARRRWPQSLTTSVHGGGHPRSRTSRFNGTAKMVESGCGAVAVGSGLSVCRPLSFLAVPQVTLAVAPVLPHPLSSNRTCRSPRIRLSDKTSRLHPRTRRAQVGTGVRDRKYPVQVGRVDSSPPRRRLTLCLLRNQPTQPRSGCKLSIARLCSAHGAYSWKLVSPSRAAERFNSLTVWRGSLAQRH